MLQKEKNTPRKVSSSSQQNNAPSSFRQALMGAESKQNGGSSWLQSSADEVEIFLCNPHVNEEIDNLVSVLQPSQESEARHASILRFVEALIKRNLGAKVFPAGSFASKTYLPDCGLNISIFFTHNHQRTWIQRVIKSLLKEDMPQSSSSSSLSSLVKEDLNQPQIPIENMSVSSTSFIKTSHFGQVVQANIDNVVVEISANQTQSLSWNALLEEVDRLVGREHLFKRTLILSKAWASYEAKILGSEDGFLNSYCIYSMLMFIFNAFYNEIETPLQGLWKLIEYTAKFDWESYAWALYGPIELSSGKSKRSDHVCSWPQGVEPLIPNSLIARYSVPHNDESDSENSPKNRFICLLDPRDSSSNLGSGFTRQSAAMIREAFVSAAKVFRQYISQWFANRQHTKTITGIFRNTLNKFQMFECPKVLSSRKDELLDGNLNALVQQIMNASEFDVPDISEDDLVDLVKSVLEENGGVVTVGKMGSLMHAATNNHSLPAMLKSKYGGLKKLLRRHPETFFIASDHPHNPRVYLKGYVAGIPSVEPNGLSSISLDFESRDSPESLELSNANSTSVSPRKDPASSFSPTFLNSLNSSEKLVDVPDKFKCPISKQILTDPVVASDGFTYERAHLERWIEEKGSISPMTNERLNFPFSYPNVSLLWVIEQFQAGNLSLKSEK
jgi:hypothetical protein